MRAIDRIIKHVKPVLEVSPTNVMLQNVMRDAEIVRDQISELQKTNILLTSIAMSKNRASLKFTTKQAQILTELGFTVRHEYFCKDEFVKLYQVSEYPTTGAEWERFWSDRDSFPATWSIVND